MSPAEEAVGVLVTPALPGVVRPREVEGHARAPLDPPVVVELCAVVGRHGLEPRAAPAHETDRPPAQPLGRPVGELADEHQPGLALDER